MFVKSGTAASLAAVFVAPKDLDISDPTSIRSVASTLAHGTMSYYTGNITNTPATIAVFPPPHYWWQAGAAWGAMLDYSHYTGDSSYDEVITQALVSQVGPAFDFMVPAHQGDEGNDDQAFWSFAVLDAVERNWPQPNADVPPWLQIAENIWNTMMPRWNTSSCGGGLAWQIFPDNSNGMDYKNAVSNGGFFQLSARLARATGNETYAQWANTIYDWSETVGFINQDYLVLDGASSKANCNDTNPVSFSYSQGIYMYGAAVMYNYTDGNTTWGDRTNNLIKGSSSYFGPDQNATNIMYEHACETHDTCNTDMKSFKGYLSRFMWATTLMMPSTLPDVQPWLHTSAVAAGQACSGGDNGIVCGEKWYVGGYDNNPGLGQQMTALETVQGLLVGQSRPPYKGDEIQHVTTAA
ncbi:glycoside hydrolase [Xylariomycetidae sp. FL2044]|nr:glycoside hydrolase [Xylariomycetidae sp. FL2044]